MTGDLLVIVPSRGRPRRLREMINACAALATAATDITVAVDSDEIGLYAPLHHDWPDVEWFTGPRDTLAGWTNRIATLRGSGYRALASFGDDHVPRTPGGDSLLVAAIDGMGGTGISYPDDKRRPDIPEAVVISSDIVQALGWMCEPSLRHFRVDDVWADLGHGAGCLRYVPEAVVEHMHYSVKPGVPRDGTYADAEARGAEDHAAYQAWRATRMAADVKTIVRLREGCPIEYPAAGRPPQPLRHARAIDPGFHGNCLGLDPARQGCFRRSEDRGAGEYLRPRDCPC